MPLAVNQLMLERRPRAWPPGSASEDTDPRSARPRAERGPGVGRVTRREAVDASAVPERVLDASEEISVPLAQRPPPPPRASLTPTTLESSRRSALFPSAYYDRPGLPRLRHVALPRRAGAPSWPTRCARCSTLGRRGPRSSARVEIIVSGADPLRELIGPPPPRCTPDLSPSCAATLTHLAHHCARPSPSAVSKAVCAVASAPLEAYSSVSARPSSSCALRDCHSVTPDRLAEAAGASRPACGRAPPSAGARSHWAVARDSSPPCGRVLRSSAARAPTRGAARSAPRRPRVAGGVR